MNRPSATWKLRTCSYSGVTPMILVLTFSRPARAWEKVLISGATARTSGVNAESARAWASSSVRVAALP